jgi:hypothetical protein
VNYPRKPSQRTANPYDLNEGLKHMPSEIKKVSTREQSPYTISRDTALRSDAVRLKRT